MNPAGRPGYVCPFPPIDWPGGESCWAFFCLGFFAFFAKKSDSADSPARPFVLLRWGLLRRERRTR